MPARMSINTCLHGPALGVFGGRMYGQKQHTEPHFQKKFLAPRGRSGRGGLGLCPAHMPICFRLPLSSPAFVSFDITTQAITTQAIIIQAITLQAITIDAIIIQAIIIQAIIIQAIIIQGHTCTGHHYRCHNYIGDIDRGLVHERLRRWVGECG
jgi:hypothetical protein